MKFDWREFTKKNFANYCTKMENSKCDYYEGLYEYAYDEYIGCVRVGDLCFDLLIRFDGNGNKSLTYDLYVGGVDTEYGYSNPNKLNKELYNSQDDYPYDCVNGSSFADTCITMSYDDFKSYAEAEFEHFIKVENETYKEASLIEKANEPLKVW